MQFNKGLERERKKKKTGESERSEKNKRRERERENSRFLQAVGGVVPSRRYFHNQGIFYGVVTQYASSRVPQNGAHVARMTLKGANVHLTRYLLCQTLSKVDRSM